MKGAPVLLAILVAFLVGCTEATHDPPLPPKPATVDLTMRDYRFDYDRDQSISEGRVAFRVRNAGRAAHQVVILDIPDNLSGSLDRQLHSPTRRRVLPLSILPTRRPDQTGAFAVDLPRGRYGVVCFLRAADGKSHALKGMNFDFWVR